MRVFRFPKIKARAVSDDDIVLDLDKLVADPIHFRWKGKIFTINPLTTEEFLRASQALAHMHALQKRNKLTPEELFEAYLGMIRSVCPEFHEDDLKSMGQHAIGALWNLIQNFMTGDAHREEKKSPEPEQTPNSSN